MFQDIKNIIKYNILDIYGIINSDFIIYCFIISLIFLLVPLLNVFSIVFLVFFITLSLRQFLKQIAVEKSYIEFFINPAENFSSSPKIENIFKNTDKSEIKLIFINSLLSIFITNIWIPIILILIYFFFITIKLSFFMKGIFIFVLVLLTFCCVLMQIFSYFIFPLVLLKSIEVENHKEFIKNVLQIWDDFKDENTLIFFRSLFFDTFWRIIILLIILSPILIFIFIFYKILITNIIFSVFIGWLMISLLLGLFITLLVIDLVKNYYIYFNFV